MSTIPHIVITHLTLDRYTYPVWLRALSFFAVLASTTVALRSGAIFRRSVPSFEVAHLTSMSHTDGTAASRAREKQPANHSDTTVSPSPEAGSSVPTPFPPFTPPTPDDRLTSLENSVAALIALMQNAQRMAQQQAQPPPQLQQQLQPPLPHCSRHHLEPHSSHPYP
ncbi:hypothetical protein K439DRAFT_455937 [Ramaria rubella]|nr:hypothetical protein K439DRAFT_455937 [Ramaria rubella]